ncbi:GntR family transcriptional regulator [Paenibacillus yanchengensis]|uniref:GntR family transcriptional regulator n=1 Tax=Paenibacillus yanchengensis TaxID=2035833 RepID=A0ABW4YIP5_9BACL
MQLSRQKGPLYIQVQNILRDRILHGVYPLQADFPSEPELAEEFKISRITVRNAVKELVTEGYLETSSGKRTKVIRNEMIAGRVKGKRFTELLQEKGHTVHSRWLSVNQGDTFPSGQADTIAIVMQAEREQHHDDDALAELFADRYTTIERLYYLNDQPYIHYTHFLAGDVGDLALSTLEHIDSLYDLIKQRQITLMKFQDQFTIRVASTHLAEQLQVDVGTPLLERQRYSYDDHGRLIEFSIGHYNTMIMPYHVDYI